MNQQFGRHVAPLRIGADRRTGIGDSVANRKARHRRANRFDDAGGLHARHAGRLQEVEEPGAAIDINEVDADHRMTDPHLVRHRRRQPDFFQLKHFRPAIMFDNDRPGCRDLAWTGGRQGTRRACGRRRGDNRPGLSRVDRRARACASQQIAHGREACLIDAFGDQPDQFVAAMRRRMELGAPFPEGRVAVGHRLQPHGGDIAHQRQRRLEQAIAQPSVPVGQRKQLFTQFAAVGQPETAYRPDRIDRLATLDLAEGNCRVPAVMAVEVAQDRPDLVNRRIDDRALANPDHRPTSAPEPVL